MVTDNNRGDFFYKKAVEYFYRYFRSTIYKYKSKVWAKISGPLGQQIIQSYKVNISSFLVKFAAMSVSLHLRRLAPHSPTRKTIQISRSKEYGAPAAQWVEHLARIPVLWVRSSIGSAFFVPSSFIDCPTVVTTHLQ